MRVLFDTNVILDVLWARAPHAESAVALLDHVARKELDALLCATSVTTIFYLVEKASEAAEARRHIATLLDIFDIAAVTRSALADALELQFKDYEDAVLHEAARHAGATAIVTRNPKDFTAAKLRLYQPAELLKLLDAAR
ncbi:MAG: PIN domain-containing protein [Steroidobacteraceae bacterium]